VRMINRLRDLMTSVFPSLERALDYSSHKGGRCQIFCVSSGHLV
jgi:hypothetical protein